MTPDSKFYVDITNNPRRRFDDANEAVAYAASKVYLHGDFVASYCNAVQAGRKVEWTYGFASVEIGVAATGEGK